MSPRSGPGTRQAPDYLRAAPHILTQISHLGELIGYWKITSPVCPAGQHQECGRRRRRKELPHLPSRRVGTPLSQHPWGLRSLPA